MKKFNVLALVFLIASWSSFAFAAGGGPSGGGGGSTPGGAAGGVLGGTYPNPTFSTTAANATPEFTVTDSSGTAPDRTFTIFSPTQVPFTIRGNYTGTDSTQFITGAAEEIFLTPTAATDNLEGLQGGVGSLGSQTMLRLIGSNFNAYVQGNQSIDTVSAYVADAETQGSSGTIGNMEDFSSYGLYVTAGTTVTNAYNLWAHGRGITGTVTNLYGVGIEAPQVSGAGTIGANFSFWSAAQGGTATNAYSFWDDSQGVFRIKDDNTFNAVYQAIPALYNPQFPKYTPGKVDFERGVLGEWESNVYTIGTQAGGTGTLRGVKIIGASLDVPSTFTIGGSAKGTRFASGTLAATDSATVGCTDTSTAVTGATTAMTVVVSPVGAPSGTGSGNVTWSGYATAGNITIRVCTLVVVTAAATTYNYVVLN